MMAKKNFILYFDHYLLQGENMLQNYLTSVQLLIDRKNQERQKTNYL